MQGPPISNSLPKSFFCNQCGLCCQKINHVGELKEFDLGNGTCKNLDLESNKCRVYDNRPDICRIDVMYSKHYNRVYEIETFYMLNEQVCKQLQSDKAEATLLAD